MYPKNYVVVWSWVVIIKSGNTSSMILPGVLISIRKKVFFGNHTLPTLLSTEKLGYDA